MFDINESQHRAALRFARRSTRRLRSDAGQSRLPPSVLEHLRRAALAHNPPSVARVHRDIVAACIGAGLKPPARASLYNALARIDGHRYRVADLPDHVAEAVHNLAPGSDVPGHQLAFSCFNHGSLAAVSYAAALPWLDLYQAARVRGWRARSRGLLAAVMRARGLR